MITEDQIFMIEKEKKINGYLVKRVNSSEFDVIEDDGFIVFNGEDYEVAKYLNFKQNIGE